MLDGAFDLHTPYYCATDETGRGWPGQGEKPDSYKFLKIEKFLLRKKHNFSIELCWQELCKTRRKPDPACGGSIGPRPARLITLSIADQSLYTLLRKPLEFHRKASAHWYIERQC